MMLSWSNGAPAEPSPGNMSRSDLLRGVISERLSAAAREILAVVERTVAEYEEEASGFREEIDRQRRQLELLLPEIKQETPDEQQRFPVCEAAGGRLPEEEGGDEQHKYQQIRVEDSWSLGTHRYTEQHVEDVEEDDEDPYGRPPLSGSQDQQHFTELDYDMRSRFMPPTVQPSRRRVGRPRQHCPLPGVIYLKVRFLEDSGIDVLSTYVFQKYPLHYLRCPIGLPEAEFLDLLRSTFPKLVPGETFEVFVSDRTRKLLPLEVNSLRPAEIHKALSSMNSALYIQQKRQTSEGSTFELPKEVPGEPLGEVSRERPREIPRKLHKNQRRRLRPRDFEDKNYVPIRVRVLDEDTDMLSSRMFNWFPLHELQCPRGLQMDGFRDFLSSTFTQLATPFDIFIIDKHRKLVRLELKTPEEIFYRGIGALYVRPRATEENAPLDDGEEKEGEEEEEEEEEEERSAAAAEGPPSSPIPTTPNITALPDRMRSSKWIQEVSTHLDLKVRILEDSQIDAMSPSVFQDYPLHHLQCPRGLKEADFMHLLRSTFPQLAAIEPFEVLAGQGLRIKSLRVDSLTPEEIYRVNKSSAVPLIYIRPQAREQPASQLWTSDLSPTSSNVIRVMDGRLGQVRHAIESDTHIVLNVRFLGESRVQVLFPALYKRYPLHELLCPRGLTEAVFRDQLRTIFPQLAADEAFEVLMTDQSKMLLPLDVSALTPDAIVQALRSSGASTAFIRLKAQEKFQADANNLQVPQRSSDVTEDSRSFSEQTGPNRSSPVQQEENGASDPYTSSTSDHREDETEDADNGGDRDESASLWSLQSLLHSESDKVSDGDDNWKPNKRDEHLRNSEPRNSGVKRRRTKQMKSSPNTPIENPDAMLSCRVCRILRGSMNMLIKHAWSHVDDRETLCGVCGERSPSAEELRSHLQTHQKTHCCNICGKSFLTVTGLRGHVARHTGNTPYKCKTCHKAFTEKSVLKNHEWIHASDKPHKCNVCQKSYVSKIKLQVHQLTHSGWKPYNCDVCGKCFRSMATLSQHMVLHSGQTAARERLHVCEICGKKFSTEKKLQIHVKYHSSQRLYACSKCHKRFLSKSNLAIHMRVHTGERPYQCPICGMTFSQKHCVTRHMVIHRPAEMSPIDE